jgi:hypothetical protein
MKKPFRWVIVAICGVLLGLVCYRLMHGSLGNLRYAKVRVLSIFLHRGMSTAGVQSLLGEASVVDQPPPTPAPVFLKTPDGSIAFPAAFTSIGVQLWYYSFDHRRLSMDFISTNAYVSWVLTNWVWSDR